MSLEAKIDELTAAIGKLNGTLQLVNQVKPEVLQVSAGTVQPKVETTGVTGPVQKRGRPSAADKAAAEAVKVQAVTAVAEEDSFLDEESAPEQTAVYTQEDVRQALVRLQKDRGKDAALKVLKDVGSADNLKQLVEAKYAAVIAAANKR